MAGLRWKCGSCEEWHAGPCLDFGYDAPYYWRQEQEETSRIASRLPTWSKKTCKTFRDENYCVIDEKNFFVRGNIHLPIVGAGETFRWGVWGSLSREHFETLLKMDGNPELVKLPAMFSWLSSQISEYPDTLSLKMYLHLQEHNQRPYFELERTDHLLSQEYHLGIRPERLKQIMMGRLSKNE